MEDRIVEINAQIEESRLDQLEASLNNLGVKFTVQKQLTFEDLGLVEVETGLFQCLVCSKMNKRKHNAVAHFRKQHTYQEELTCHCPRCEIEVPKSRLNLHMDQAHGIKMFNKLVERSFQPDTPSNFPMKITRPFSDSDPLTFSQEEFNNNNVKDSKGKVKSSQKKAKKRKIETSSDSEDYEEKDLVEDESDGSMKMKINEPVLDSDTLNLSQEEFITDIKTEQSFQESEENTKSENFHFDFESKDDVNDSIKQELAYEESEEIPILEIRTDLNKKKSTTDKTDMAGSSRKNKKK